MKALLNEEILLEQMAQADFANAIDICSYNHGPLVYLLGQGVSKPIRLLLGIFESVDASRAVALASRYPKVKVRLLRGLHAKLFITRRGPARGLRVILGSANLGASRSLETGILVSGGACEPYVSFFEANWLRGTPVKPLDAQAIAKSLASSVFEDRRESAFPDQPTINRRTVA